MFGKFIGAFLGIYLTRSITGAIVGAIVGHIFFDKATRTSSSRQYRRGFTFGSTAMFQRQDLYFQLFFGLLGKIAKIDGTISQEEENFLDSLLNQMNIHGPPRTLALQYFHNASTNSQTSMDIASQFYQATTNQPQLCRQLLYQLVGLASADSVIIDKERRFLEEIAGLFHLPNSELEHMIHSFDVKDDKHYHTLGISPNVSNDEVRKAYKTLLKEYHPDTLQCKGLHPSMLAFAEQRFLDIKQAWESIRKERGIE